MTLLAPRVPVSDPFGAVPDAALPALPLALDPELVQAELCRALARPVRLEAVRVIRHKPGRRCLLEYDIREADGEPLTLVAKMRRKRSGRSAFELARDLQAAGVPVPEPLGAVKPLRVWLQRKVPGSVLTELVGAPRGARLTEEAGRAVRSVHGAAIAPKRAHTMADELRILGTCLLSTAAARGDLARRIERLLDRCGRLGATAPASPACGIHRDLYADQVVVDGDHLWLLDFDLYCLGDPALDAGNFLGHVVEQALREHGDPAALGGAEAAFLEGFLSAGRPVAHGAIDAYTTLTLARHVFLSTTLPGRAWLTDALLELCEQRLASTAKAIR